MPNYHILLSIVIQSSKKHNMINHSDRRTLYHSLLGNMDISFGLFNVFTYLDIPAL